MGRRARIQRFHRPHAATCGRQLPALLHGVLDHHFRRRVASVLAAQMDRHDHCCEPDEWPDCLRYLAIHDPPSRAPRHHVFCRDGGRPFHRNRVVQVRPRTAGLLDPFRALRRRTPRGQRPAQVGSRDDRTPGRARTAEGAGPPQEQVLRKRFPRAADTAHVNPGADRGDGRGHLRPGPAPVPSGRPQERPPAAAPDRRPARPLAPRRRRAETQPGGGRPPRYRRDRAREQHSRQPCRRASSSTSLPSPRARRSKATRTASRS